MLPTLDPSLVLPARRYAIGLSGGADSVYLTLAASQLICANDLILVHVNHELRGAESDADESFCVQLAQKLKLSIACFKKSQIEPTLSDLPANPSARYRLIRHAAFKQVITYHHLDAVLLAHHADDQAETVFTRLSRGGSIYSLCGMRPHACIKGLQIVRPMLHVRSADLRTALQAIKQVWREDSSNTSTHYRRNVARQILQANAQLSSHLCALADASQKANDALDALTPTLPQRFACQQLASMPAPVASHAARRWLIERGCDADDVSQAVCDRLIAHASDAASALRQHYPGKLLVRRKQKHIEVVQPNDRKP